MNHRSKRSSLLDPSAAEFSMEAESALMSTSQSIQRSSYQSDRSSRRCSRTQSHATPRIATSCKTIRAEKNESRPTLPCCFSDEYKFGGYGRGVNEFLEPNGISFLSDGTISVVDTNSSQVKLFDPVRRECVLKFGQAGTRPGALLYPYRVAVLPGHDLVRLTSSTYDTLTIAV